MQEHIVPQQITKYEFKILAGLTWKQFILLGATLTVSYIFYDLTSKGVFPTWFGYPAAVLLFIGVLILGFVRVEGKTLAQALSKLISYMSLPILRVWRKPQMPPVPYEQRHNTKPKLFPDYLKIYFLPKFNLSTKQAIHRFSKGIEPDSIKIDQNYLSQNIDPTIKVPAIPNTLAIKIVDYNNQAIPNAIVVIQDKIGRPLLNGKSNKYGIIYFNRPLPSGKYKLSITSPQEKLQFPIYHIELTGRPLPLIILKPLNPKQKKTL